ncbi:tetratricopeptide repeat protein [Stenotrophomonas sp.]|uniref:tetratricopeptide repeat protein n=1 Tax=Stenotrophomonas sp. TaxID=69392 RepID=UPI0028AE1897|nr:tetratricopeptide repeat protein [Stenotrophomonas sp.]
MNPCIGRTALRLGVVAFSLALAACGTAPLRTPASIAQSLETAAADGSVDSLLDAARTYETFNDPRAVGAYERAAAVTPWTFQNSQAEEALGRIWTHGELLHGSGPNIVQGAALRPSPRRAERWYRAAAAHGNPMAMLMLARFYRDRGDAANALRWDLRATIYHRMSSESSRLPQAIAPKDGVTHPLVLDIQARARRGDADAQVDLGTLYETGMGLPRDGEQALHWYGQAAAQGNVHGQYFSGLLLGRGRAGVTRDVDAAAGWFAKAYAQRFYLAGETYWRKTIEPPFWTFD